LRFYIWLHDSKLSTQNVQPTQKPALSVKENTERILLVSKEKKKTAKKRAFNRFALKRVCIATDLCDEKVASKSPVPQEY